MTVLSADVLTPLFASRLGRETRVSSVERGPVGNGQEIWFVSVEVGTDSRRFALRRTARGGPLDWTDRGREFRTLGALAAAGLPVPRGHWWEPEGNPLGEAYFVMDHMAGRPAGRAPAEIRLDVASDLGRWMARLHGSQIDPDTIGLDPPGDAAAATRAELSAWAGRYRGDRIAPVPAVGVLLAYLDGTASGRDEPAVLLWGDAGPHNALHEAGTVTAMLDWELSHFGDPHEDLGSLAWSYGVEETFDSALRAYEDEAGRSMDRDRIRYFEVMACATRSIMLLNAVAHYIAGSTTAPNLAGLGLQLIPANLERAGRALGWTVETPPELATGRIDPARPRPDSAELLAGTIRFLRDELLPATSDPTLRRGLRTTEALLATAALRITAEPAVGVDRKRAAAALLTDLEDAGVDVSEGLEAAAIVVEVDPSFSGLRGRVHAHLMADAAAMKALAGPLNDLYGA